MIVAFIPEGIDSPGTLSTIKYAKKFNFGRDKNFKVEMDNLILFCKTNF